MENIFFTSDTHYNHKNIVRGVSEWKDNESPTGIQRKRDFDTLEEHNNMLVEKINNLVGKNDVLYHLGDWSFGGLNSIKEFRDRLNCENIHLIYGNHDQHIEADKKCGEIGFGDSYQDLYTQNLFSSVQYYKQLKIKGCPMLILSHYAMRVWDGSHKGTIQLFGHSHGSLPDLGNRQMDVGVDTHNLYPYHLDEILEKMVNREVKIVDHHNQYTN